MNQPRRAMASFKERLQMILRKLRFFYALILAALLNAKTAVPSAA
ncbi:hypothetical protein [Burkholderia ubonensis]|nr:hypothetical protein [Burkholderia ubonensis]